MRHSIGYLQEIGPDDLVRQGDIFSIQSTNEEHEKWAVLLTKDCDIVQEKFGSHLTYLPIYSFNEYIEKYYSPKKIEILKSENMKNVINTFKYLIGDEKEAFELTEESLQEWISDEGIEGICGCFESNNKKKGDLDKYLRTFSILTDSSARKYSNNNWRRILDVHLSNGKNEDKIKKEICNHILKSMGDEFIFVPELPEVDSAGFIIHLREIKSIDCSQVFASAYNAKKIGATFPRLIRIGRFSDYLRFSIAQNAALLFSRIGMEENFEVDRKIMVDLASESAVKEFLK
ncbi:hypothetical protein SAMN04488056_1303 [Cohaesibacter marisflavi]|uniref:Uncharacterized protein n=1 Tax=Cohaesibacter marisflavi TaxID=655353 RepID=A0A1I5NF61_9HYPH|nr:hypothetical protein [Cohaesibacter marisflavi]SFP20367.1 hypothetical protein SAMN04488056_1303 [Cohaesibacter marisflavi]